MSEWRGFVRVLILLLGCTAQSYALAESWGHAKPKAATSRNGEWVVRVDPGAFKLECYEQADVRCAYATVFRFDAKRQSYQRARDFELMNPEAPLEVYITEDGRVVTVDDHGRLGRLALVIYTVEGKARKAFELEDLLTKEEIAASNNGETTFWWRSGQPYPWIDDDEIYLPTSGAGIKKVDLGTLKVESLGRLFD